MLALAAQTSAFFLLDHLPLLGTITRADHLGPGLNGE